MNFLLILNICHNIRNCVKSVNFKWNSFLSKYWQKFAYDHIAEEQDGGSIPSEYFNMKKSFRLQVASHQRSTSIDLEKFHP